MWQRILQSPDWRYIGAIIPFMALLQLIGPETLRYQADWLQSGQAWRVLTAHWVHVGWMHWGLNSLALVIMVGLTTPGWRARRWLFNTITLALGISLLTTLLNPEIDNYAGHSGILYGLYILGAVSLFRHDRLIAVLVAAAIIGKVFMEQFQFYDFNTSSLIGAKVIIDSHLYGTLIGVCIALLQATITMNHRTKEVSN